MSIRVHGDVRGLLVGFAFLFTLVPALADPAPPAADSYARAHRAVSTSVPAAQAAFDDGLTLLYAFNPEEARRAFERAVASDPALALAWWGIAMSYGANINESYDAASQRLGRTAIAKAERLATAAPVERALIGAAAARFALAGARDGDRSARAYRDAMNAAATAYPADDDVQTLAAEAEMDVHPWDYFATDGRATPGTAGIIARLDSVLARDPMHVGANHFAIHAYEESPYAERALPAARRLASLSFEPAAEHLAHMPAHIFMRVGDYRAAGEANARALDLYRTYLAGAPAGHADYLGHDCLFGVDAFMMAGDYARARDIASSCDRGSGRLVARVDLRFRRYDRLARDASPEAFVRGMTELHAGDAAAATRDLALLRRVGDDASAIASDVLEAALAAARGDRVAQLAALERAVAAQDAQGYAEPPRFWFPVRESLGGAQLAAARPGDAERTFRADLARNPANPRALFGLARALRGEGREPDAREATARFSAVWPEAAGALDVKDL